MSDPSPFHQAVADPLPGQQNFEGGEVAQSNDSSPYPEEVRIDGTAQLGFFDAGGKQPQSASLLLVGGNVKLVEGKAFRKGDVITGQFTAVVNEVAVRDSHDSQTGIVISAEQKHKARITDLTVQGAGYSIDGSGS
jgi:hypothetical protein